MTDIPPDDVNLIINSDMRKSVVCGVIDVSIDAVGKRRNANELAWV